MTVRAQLIAINMSYIKIKNPLENDVMSCFRGEYITFQAGETKSLAEDAAQHFLETFGFLEVVAKEEAKEVTEEVKEEVVEVKKKVAKK